MKRLAIIPARKGSKGLPDKNMEFIGGCTLIMRAMECAYHAKVFDRIVVSTDYPEPPLWHPIRHHPRPPELAGDDVSVSDVVAHVLETYTGFDVLAVLQPTSPTRTPEIVRQCVEAIDDEFDAAWTVSRVPEKWNMYRQMNGAIRLSGNGLVEMRRQDIPPRVAKNGQCYAVTTKAFAEHGLAGSWCCPIITTAPFITIDTQEDLDEARRLLG